MVESMVQTTPCLVLLALCYTAKPGIHRVDALARQSARGDRIINAYR